MKQRCIQDFLQNLFPTAFEISIFRTKMAEAAILQNFGKNFNVGLVTYYDPCFKNSENFQMQFLTFRTKMAK